MTSIKIEEIEIPHLERKIKKKIENKKTTPSFDRLLFLFINGVATLQTKAYDFLTFFSNRH